MQKSQKTPKKVAKQSKIAKKAPLRQAKRKMTIFAGTKTGSEQIFATGSVKRTAGGKTTEFPMCLEFTATPALNTLAITQHRFIPGSGLVDTFTEALLLDPKGESAKVKAMTVEPIIKESSAKLTGPAFAWTKSVVTSTGTDGNKFETTMDFGKDKKFTFKLNITGKDAAVEDGAFQTVEKAQFYDFVRTAKGSHERMKVEGADATAAV